MHEHETPPPVGKDRVTGPVCGLRVDADAPLQAHYRDTDYRFCSQHWGSRGVGSFLLPLRQNELHVDAC